MKSATTVLVAFLFFTILPPAGAATPSSQPAAVPAEQKIALKIEVGGLEKVFTPARMLGGMWHSFRSGFNDVSGDPIPMRLPRDVEFFRFSLRKAGSGFELAIDADGNGTAEPAEFKPLPAQKAAIFRLYTAQGWSGLRDYAVAIREVRVNTHKGGQLDSMFGDWRADFSLAGMVGKTPIRILDDNADRKITQDGKDAILIGASRCAIPLLKVHQIGGMHCVLTVAADGSSVTITPLDKPPLAAVVAAMPKAQLNALVLASDTAAYDVAEVGRTGIVAGTYRLVYGLMGNSGLVFQERSAGAPTYDLQAGKMNTLTIGQPLQLDARGSADPATGKVKVQSLRKITGPAGEEIRVLRPILGGHNQPHGDEVLEGIQAVGTGDAHLDLGSMKLALMNGSQTLRVVTVEQAGHETAEREAEISVAGAAKSAKLILALPFGNVNPAVATLLLSDVVQNKSAEVAPPPALVTVSAWPGAPK